MLKFLYPLLGLSFSLAGPMATATYMQDRAAIEKMAGCYMVDYNFYETESLQEGYKLDSRVYDVDVTKSVKELIVPLVISDSHIRLQHFLFFTDNAGVDQGLLKHQAEDWIFEPSWSYEFIEPNHWEPKDHPDFTGKWVRRVTALDDGLRYQCLAAWNHGKKYPEWSCANFAPIPGRETRDMGRKDYNSLERLSRVILYPGNWLERENNIKTVLKDRVKTPLAREVGKTWYIQIPKENCAVAEALYADRAEFWAILQGVWEDIFAKKESWKEYAKLDDIPRYEAMGDVEDMYWDKIKADSKIRDAAKSSILSVIERYKAK